MIHTEQETPVEHARQSSWMAYALALLLAVATFFSGLYIGERGSVFGRQVGLSTFLETGEVSAAADVSLTEFWRVWNLLDEKYANASSTEQISNEARMYGAISGMVAAFGDPYTVFLPPEESERFQDDISGNFSGVGMEVGLRNDLITIIAPLQGTPAERAGLLSEDVITKIDDTSTDGMRIDEAVRRIRGEKGTTVTFEIFREGEEEVLTIPVVRDTIDIPTVKTERVEDTFIISLYSFNAISDSKMEEAMREFEQSGLKNVVIDVRGNPGGFMQSAVDIASLFLPSGKVVVREQSGSGVESRVFRTRNRQIRDFTADRLVVLVDGGSASASEILAGALRDHGVATVIGDQTFGKGSVQELVELEGGAALKVTVARWLTPNGTSISDGGLTPDIVIKRTPADRQEGIDPQREAALKFLRGETVASQTDVPFYANPENIGS